MAATGALTRPPSSVAVPAIGLRGPERTFLRDAWSKFVKNRLAVAGLVVMAGIFAIGIFGPLVAPYDYLHQDLLNQMAPPSRAHLLGTDELGRDLLSRVLWGGRTALLVATVVTSLTLVLGVTFGATAAYLGGFADALFVRVVDLLQTFPGLLLALLLASMTKPAVNNLSHAMATRFNLDLGQSSVYVDYLVVFGALSAVGWYGVARLIRGQILSLRAAEFVLAARAVGVTERRIIFRHLVPNAIGPVIVALSGAFGGAMLSESSLSYLGMGIQPPGASWGAMIQTSMLQWRYHPHLVLVPGFILFLAVISATFIGDGLNDAFSPRSQRK